MATRAKPSFALGFMIGHDATWLPAAVHLLREELPNLHVVISTQNSPQLATALSRGMIDVAILRPEDGGAELEFVHLVDEPLQVFLHKDHRLARRKAIDVREIAGETFLSVSGAALSVSGRPPALRRVVDRYLKANGVEIRPSHEVDNLGGVMSLLESTRGVALLPAYAKTFLPGAVVIRPLKGVTPTIELSVGYKRGNESAVLKLFLARVGGLVDQGSA
jgi:LysR family hca operon transcriptional activator